MMYLLFLVLFVFVFKDLIGLIMNLSFGILKLFFGVLFLPLVLIIGLALGFVKLILPFLVIWGIITLLKNADSVNAL
ncbi:MAG: hypothetical protein Q4D13_03670 [Erysipelotrichaceae bacterium]|nr:hypothetical protein [Erysipelotrichaceae bacterium]